MRAFARTGADVEATVPGYRRRWMAAAVALAITLPAAAAPNAPVTAAAGAGVCGTCGVVRSVRYVEQAPQTSRAGRSGGNIVGKSSGDGRSRTSAALDGAGARAGYVQPPVPKVDRALGPQKRWIVAVKMDNGTSRNYVYGNKPDFKEDDRVRTSDDGRTLALAPN